MVWHEIVNDTLDGRSIEQVRRDPLDESGSGVRVERAMQEQFGT